MARILVIDDDNDMCLLLNRFLTRNGYEVTGMNSGQAAIEWMKKNQPDLALCDFRLEDMTGAEMLVKIKEMHPGAPVIIITGYSDVKDAVEVMKMGAYDYVTKPLFPDEILLTIKKALSESGGGNAQSNSAETTTSAKPAQPSSGATCRRWGEDVDAITRAPMGKPAATVKAFIGQIHLRAVGVATGTKRGDESRSLQAAVGAPGWRGE